MWTDYAKDSLLIAGRIATIYPLMLVIGLIMGKRSLGELPVFDFLVILSLGSVIGADIAEPSVNHIHIAIAILLIGLLQRVVSSLSIKYRRFGKLISFEPTVVVHQGNLLVHNLKKARYSIDNILQMLREKDVFHLADVEFAVLEANGKLTVYKKSPKSAPTLEELGLIRMQSDLSYPLIVEGTVYQDTLSYIKKDTAWLDSQLQAKGVGQDDIFFASVDNKGNIYISDPTLVDPPPIRH
ncbi:DUF421 domain-containing protein [Paenibacillus glycanilyticus]|uniref:DUF421 domain-containing protein n=1 Tax=Paenibacillus glycanilyticus TaxID=126569 RepID=UPI0020402BB9|nr:DUF421 domain-containing protein [Paenibacillus glycanilyticus]MCM3627715.1 DUF421 domain-containing protein [Paenibacillus glycanilyticus]